MDVNHLPLLECVGRDRQASAFSRPAWRRSAEVERASRCCDCSGAGPVALLHCVSVYPWPPELVNLRKMETWRQAFGVPVGLQRPHTGQRASLWRRSLWASASSRSTSLWTTDWRAGITRSRPTLPSCAQLVEGSRRSSRPGQPGPHREPAEVEKRKAFRRGWLRRGALRPGERLTADDVEFKRPGTGIQPDELRYVRRASLAARC